VHAGRILLLGGDIRVADHTAVRHGSLFPESWMAGGAFIGEISMGSYAAQRRAGLGIKPARAEKQVPTHQPHHNNDEDGQNPDNNAGKGYETWAGIIHQ
jgi:hypothetical protein